MGEEEFTVAFQRLADAVAFYNVCLENTRFAHANVEWDQVFGNLQPIDAKVCPEYNQYEQEIQGKRNKNLNFENNLIYINTREDRFRARGTFISFGGGIS